MEPVDPNAPGDDARRDPAPREADEHADGWALADHEQLPISEAEAREVVAEIREIAGSRPDDPDDPSAGERAPARATTEHEPLSPEELRDAWPLLALPERSDGLSVLSREDAEDFFIALPATDQAEMLLHWKPGLRRQWLRLLEPDDVADVIQEATAAADEDEGGEPWVRTALLGLLDEPTRKEVSALLAYAEDEAGGLMNTRFAHLRPQMRVDEAISYLRRQAQGTVETIYTAYVLDAELHLIGVVSFRDLFAAPTNTTVAEIMETDVVRVSEDLDQEALSRVFAEHDLNVIPVVDAFGVIKGIVAVDDIVDVVQEEATEDIQKFGGMAALDVPYLQSRRREMIRKRVPWLAILLGGGLLTTTVLGAFQVQLAHATVLMLFMPLIISSGGNAGSQASTLVIRAMALGEVRPSDWWRVIRREVATGLAMGAILAALGAVPVLIWGASGGLGEFYALLAITVGLSLVAVVVFGTLVGSGLPFVLRKIGADPASASAPMVATLSDVSGLLLYFTIANLVLSGTVL
ncbi:MAG: magnesium transporter [Kofleriaceae bacterium]